MATSGPVTVTCPLCRKQFTVPTEVVGTDGHNVIVRLDRSDVYGHLRSCSQTPIALPGKPGREPAKWPRDPELVGRIGQMLDRRAYIAKGGSRACTMCGTNAQDCLVTLDEKGKAAACCAACHNGNTHPAPGEAEGVCSEWAKTIKNA